VLPLCGIILGGNMKKSLGFGFLRRASIFGAFLCSTTYVIGETAWIGFDYIFDNQNNANHGFKIYKNTRLFDVADTFQSGDAFKTQFLDRFLSGDGKSITITKDILRDCETYIGTYQYSNGSGIANYLGKKDTETIKQRIRNALKNFKAVFDKEIQEPLSELTVATSDTDEMRHLKQFLNWSLQQSNYTQQQKNLMMQNLNDMLYRYRIPPFNIYDKGTDGTRLTRTMYGALQQLGNECGFAMKSINSWSSRMYNVATNKYFWMAVASASLLGGGYMFGKYVTTPTTCAPTGQSSWFSGWFNRFTPTPEQETMSSAPNVSTFPLSTEFPSVSNELATVNTPAVRNIIVPPSYKLPN
jgi:hypothetical protein